MNTALFLKAITRYFAGAALVALLLFLPAGTFRYPQAWLLIGLLFFPMLIAGFVMMAKAPRLLEKRLNAREKESEQRTVILFSGIMFCAAFVLAGLCFRFDFLMLPRAVTYIFAAVFLFAYLLYALVLRENEYLSRTVEVQAGQQVIDTGLYGIVRHPMYMATVLLFLSVPLILGSAVSFAVMLLYLPLIVKRIGNEEKVLERGLSGYLDYERRVKYRLIPFIW